MAAFCLFALIVGAFSAWTLSVVHFSIVVMIAGVVGIAAGFLSGLTADVVLLGALALFAAAQVGYGLGLGCRSLTGHRRDSRSNAADRVENGLQPDFHSIKPGN